MEEQGVRRIKRSFLIETTSIKAATPEMQAQTGSQHETNLACFRAYLEDYLSKRKDISNSSTLMVRLLPASEYGVPFEIYCFAITTVWTEYEKIQAQVVEHIFIALPKFGLAAYQRK
jgi:miniconductance mechanosensitive channel